MQRFANSGFLESSHVHLAERFQRLGVFKPRFLLFIQCPYPLKCVVSGHTAGFIFVCPVFLRPYYLASVHASRVAPSLFYL